MTKLAQLIAKQEGFGKPGAIPTIRHNPGDLRHSPHSSHTGIGPNDIGIIDTDDHGWQDLDRQLRLIAIDYPGITLADTIQGQRDSLGNVRPKGYPGWAPASDHNNPEVYINFLAGGLGVVSTTALSTVLLIQA